MLLLYIITLISFFAIILDEWKTNFFPISLIPHLHIQFGQLHLQQFDKITILVLVHQEQKLSDFSKYLLSTKEIVERVPLSMESDRI